MAWGELLWVDRLGMYLRAVRQDGSAPGDLRVPFVRPVGDEREARSALTMMAQGGVGGAEALPARGGAPRPQPRTRANN